MTKNKEQCRLCLTKTNPKNLHLLFEVENNIIIADMVMEIANFKLIKDDRLPKKICQTCKKKVQELYEFKILIESTNTTLCSELYPKKLNFNNINDVILKSETVKNEYYTQEYLEIDFENKENVTYKGIVIKKVPKRKEIPSVVINENLMLDEDFLNENYENDKTKVHLNENDTYEENYNDDYRDDDCDYDNNMNAETESDSEYYNKPLALRKKINKKKCKLKNMPLKNNGQELQNKSKSPKIDTGNKRADKENLKRKQLTIEPLKDTLLNKDRIERIKKREEIKNNILLEKGIIKEKPSAKVYEICELPKKKERFYPTFTLTNIKPVFMDNLVRKMDISMKPKKEKYLDLCPYCGKEFTNIKIHLLTHVGERLRCDHCPKTFIQKRILETHMKKHFGMQREYKCGQCNAAFYNKGCLTSHALSHQEKCFKCRFCEKSFKRKQGLRRHEKIHNLLHKKIKCAECNMSFICNAGLRHHMRIHTGERPFLCQLCNQPYSYRTDYIRHCLKKHKVYLKRRHVPVLNEEVLQREREITKGLVLRAHGIVIDGEPLNPFEADGPYGVLAFQQALKDIKKGCLAMDILQDQ